VRRADRDRETVQTECLDTPSSQRLEIWAAPSTQNDRVVTFGQQCRGEVAHMHLRTTDRFRSGYQICDLHLQRLGLALSLL
jgi:hypothetical protein